MVYDDNRAETFAWLQFEAKLIAYRGEEVLTLAVLRRHGIRSPLKSEIVGAGTGSGAKRRWLFGVDVGRERSVKRNT